MAEAGVAVPGWLQRLAPDLDDTVRRFPLAVFLAACGTIVFLIASNFSHWIDGDSSFRLFAGLGTGAVCAVAGVLFCESRPGSIRAGRLLAYALPVIAVAVGQVSEAAWVAPMLLPAVAVLWLSVSPVTEIGRGAARADAQNRFWWINERAAATAALAAAAFLVIWLGIVAIERSMDFLFHVSAGDLLYRWVLPVTGLFLTPVYWLATLPRLRDFQAADVERPDFVAGAVGFIGQFVLAPFLAIYALILLAYTAQIVVTQRLPEGTIGWMVLGFVVAGAATWLALYPPFMRDRRLVRWFRVSWFWLTLVPLGLFAVAVHVRVDAYGLTAERVLLIAGGIWAALLAAAFLAGRDDVRLIPGLAGVVLLVLSIGPFNVFALPDRDQGRRLAVLLADVKDPTATVSTPDWTKAEAAAARSAVDYLVYIDHGRAVLRRTLLDFGFLTEGELTTTRIMTELGYPDAAGEYAQVVYVPRQLGVTVDVSPTPYYVGHLDAYEVAADAKVLGWQPVLRDGALVVWVDGQQVLSQDLSPWAARQGADYLREPWVDFAVAGVTYRLVLTSASWWPRGDHREVASLSGVLFTEDPAVSIPRP